jgi:hypothetical protein
VRSLEDPYNDKKIKLEENGMEAGGARKMIFQVY